MQMINQLTETINNANVSCAKGTECYEREQITDARNNYKAAVITKENAPQAVDTAFKNYLIASKGTVKANEELMNIYEKEGELEKTKMTQQFNDWFNVMTNKISTLSRNIETANTLATSNRMTSNRVNELINQNDDSVNHLNLFERKIHFTGQVIKTMNKVEYCIKLVYWLAFFTWIACIIYDRDFTMKTAGLFILFAVIVFMQEQIINALYAVKDNLKLISI